MRHRRADVRASSLREPGSRLAVCFEASASAFPLAFTSPCLGADWRCSWSGGSPGRDEGSCLVTAASLPPNLTAFPEHLRWAAPSSPGRWRRRGGLFQRTGVMMREAGGFCQCGAAGGSQISLWLLGILAGGAFLMATRPWPVGQWRRAPRAASVRVPKRSAPADGSGRGTTCAKPPPMSVTLRPSPS